MIHPLRLYPRHLTAAQWAAACRRFRAERTTAQRRQLAAELGIGLTLLYRYAGRAGLPRRSYRRHARAVPAPSLEVA